MLALHPNQVRIVDLSTSPKLQHQPDVILYDTFGRFPTRIPSCARSFTRTRRRSYLQLGGLPEEAARRHGAAGYLHKGLSADELVTRIVKTHNGEHPAQVSGGREPSLTWPGQTYGLSQREAEMLTYITRGLSNDEIAHRSYLTINTVKSYVRSAYRKIGVQTPPQCRLGLPKRIPINRRHRPLKDANESTTCEAKAVRHVPGRPGVRTLADCGCRSRPLRESGRPTAVH